MISFEYVSNKQICVQDESTSGQGLAHANGTLAVVDPQPPSTPSPDLLGDLLGPLAIEGPPGTAPQSDPSVPSSLEGGSNLDDLALAPVEEQTSTVQVSFSSTYLYVIVIYTCFISIVCILGKLTC